MKIDYFLMAKILLSTLWKFWPIFLILLILLALKIFFIRVVPTYFNKRRNYSLFEAGREWRSDRDLLQWIRGMKPYEFENYITDLFSRLGYKAHAIGQSHDGGVDVIAEKDGIKNYIQCKKFITSEVRVGDVRDFYGALADHLSNGKGYFITTNKFTLEAEKFAEDKPIELVDGYKLIHYIKLADGIIK